MEPRAIAVTGSTGYVGGRVARLLDEAGVEHRLLVRDPTSPRLPALATTTAVAQAEYADREAAVRALEGIDVLLMISGSESETRVADHLTFVAAAAEAGVRHVVYTSFAAAAPDAVFTLARDHFTTEQAIEASGMAWTFLRDTLYLDFLENMVGADGVIRGPAGEGRCAVVARADVARVAATVLLDPDPHARVTYDLTGPQALTMAEAARIISDVRGRSVTFHDETLDEAYASRAVYGAPRWQVDAWVSTYTAIASNVMAQPTDDVERVTGTPPLSLEEYLRSSPS
jgi:NAD(P)H dehydrogenase (quinone)